MAVDLGVFERQKSIVDQQQLQDAFNLKKALAVQSVQTGGIDAALKRNNYATQVLSGAAAGGQDQYAATLGQLAQGGFGDVVGNYSPDVNVGMQQLQQARLAQSPLGSLLSAGSKMDANANTVAIAGGALPAGGGNGIVNNLLKTGALTEGIPVNLPSRAPSAATTLANTGLKPATAPVDTQAEYADMIAPQGAPAPQSFTSPAASLPASTTMALPPKLPNETEAAYKTRLDNDPVAIAARKKSETSAGKEGEDLAESLKTVHAVQSTLPIAMQRFNDMRIASQNANYGTGTELKADFYSNFKDSPTAKANTYLRQQSAQAVLPELGPQLQGMKGNKFLETLANDSSGLDITAPPDAKIGAVNGLENNYIGQLKISAAKVRAAGGEAPTDEEIDRQVAELKAKLPKDLSSAKEAGVTKDELQQSFDTKRGVAKTPSGVTYKVVK